MIRWQKDHWLFKEEGPLECWFCAKEIGDYNLIAVVYVGTINFTGGVISCMSCDHERLIYGIPDY